VKYLMLGPHRYWMTGRGAVLHRALETSVSDLHDRSPLATMDDADQFQERLLEGVFDDLIVREGWERGGAAFTAAVERLGTEPNYRDPPPLKPFGPPRKMSSPEEVIVTSIEREERLAALSRRQRQAVKLLDEGCSYAETAGQMGMKENALYALVYRAKKKICS
jgi:DNA-binding CsgD family transcriptional regulator